MQNPSKEEKDENPSLLTALQLHYARLYIHGEILQIHRTWKRQGQSGYRGKKKKIKMNYLTAFIFLEDLTVGWGIKWSPHCKQEIQGIACEFVMLGIKAMCASKQGFTA